MDEFVKPKNNKCYVYMRVSTSDQSTSAQRSEIEEFAWRNKLEIKRIFEDVGSGKNTDRENFKKMMEMFKENTDDVSFLLAWRLDRIGRSQRDLITILDTLRDKNIHIRTADDTVNTSTKEGYFLYSIMSIIAQYERDLINDRVKAGMKRFKDSGGTFGRPKADVDMAQVRFDVKQGIPKVKIAKKYGISKSTLYNLLASEDNVKDLNPIAVRELADRGYPPRQIANDMGVSIVKIYDALEKYAQMTKEERILAKYGNEDI